MREGRVVLCGKESRKKSLFTLLERLFPGNQQQTYVGHNWSSYARTIERLNRTWWHSTISMVAYTFFAVRAERGCLSLAGRGEHRNAKKGNTHDAISGDGAVVADSLTLVY